MAQMAYIELFAWVLRKSNASSIAVRVGKHRKRPANSRFFVDKLKRMDLLNLGLIRCISPVPATSGRVGKDTIVKLKSTLAAFAADESGATAIEYGLIAAGIALAIIEVIYALGTNLVAKLQALATALK